MVFVYVPFIKREVNRYEESKEIGTDGGSKGYNAFSLVDHNDDGKKDDFVKEAVGKVYFL